MKKIRVSLQKNCFTGVYYPAPEETDKVFIVMFGDSDHNYLIKSAAKWLHGLGCNALGISSIQQEGDIKGYHDFPLEYLENATKWLFSQGNHKVGITGGSTTGMVALIAASYIPDISLVVVGTPCDFVMQGFYRGEKEGMKEWPAVNQATVSYRGKSLPYQPFFKEEHDYWDTYQNGCKEHNEVYFLDVIRHSENTEPIPEEAYIKVENIQGKILMFAAEDDTLWDTAKYCRRMEQRLKDKGFPYPVECLIYKIGTHFVFPEGMMKALIPIGGGIISRLIVSKMFHSGREHPKECKNVRNDIERITMDSIVNW